jgi:DNA mismatch repair protein MutS
MRNLNAAATEDDGRVVFLRRIVPGGADRSYGIHVARLAGLPEHVTARAQALLAGLESAPRPAAPEQSVAPRIAERPAVYTSAQDGCPVCTAERDSSAIRTMRSVNLAATTPMEALNLLFTLQETMSLELPCDHHPARPRLAVIETPWTGGPRMRLPRDHDGTGAQTPGGPP